MNGWREPSPQVIWLNTDGLLPPTPGQAESGWVVPESNVELMAQNEVLKSQVASGSEQRDEAAEEQF
jgi:hypothetical protein